MTTSTGFTQTIQWYDDHAEEYAQQIQNSPMTTILQKFIATVGTGAKVLDAGCAGGRDCRIFLESGLVPVGVDISHSLIKYAQKQNPTIEFHHSNFLQLPFANATFDGVWSNASLLHLEKISGVEQALQEFYRVLKPGGVLHVYVKQQLGAEKTTTAAHEFSGSFERFFRFFTKSELEALLHGASFTIEDIQDNYTAPDGRPNIKWVLALAKKD